MGVQEHASDRPGGYQTNNLTKTNYKCSQSTYVNVKQTPIVLSLWPLSFSIRYDTIGEFNVPYRIFYSPVRAG